MLLIDRLTHIIITDALELLADEAIRPPMLTREACAAIEDMVARYVVEADRQGQLTSDLRPSSEEVEAAIVGGAHALARWATGHDDTWLGEEAPVSVMKAARRAWETRGARLKPVFSPGPAARFEAVDA